MGSKVLIVADGQEVLSSLGRAFEKTFEIKTLLETSKVRTKFGYIVKEDIISVLFYLNGKSFDMGMDLFCLLRKENLRYDVPFAGCGFLKEAEVKINFPIFSASGHRYVELPINLKTLIEIIKNIERHNLTKEEAEKYCPQKTGHGKK